jgi:hypothetical protein
VLLQHLQVMQGAAFQEVLFCKQILQETELSTAVQNTTQPHHQPGALSKHTTRAFSLGVFTI